MQTVFHVSSPDADVRRHALVNVNNLLEDDTVTSAADDVAIVANGAAVRMFVDGVAEHEPLVASLLAREVDCFACSASLERVDATAEGLLSGVEPVESGVGALASLQDDGYGYVKAP